MSAESLAQTLGGLFPEIADRPRESAPAGARQKGRAADWRASLSRDYAYQRSRARSPEELAALDDAYESAMQARPDFTGYRRKSDFAAAPRISLDRNALARIKFKLQAIRRGTWATKEKGKHAGSIPHSVMEVFDALAHLVVKHGRVFPSLVGLSLLATRSKQTVLNAIKVLEFYGIVTRIRRIKRIKTALGFKTVQDTNAYTLQDPNMIGEGAYRSLVGGSESRNQAARKPDSYYSEKTGRKFKPDHPPDPFWTGLREQWDAT